MLRKERWQGRFKEEGQPLPNSQELTVKDEHESQTDDSNARHAISNLESNTNSI